MVDEREIGKRVKEGIIGVIRGTGEITQTAVETVASTVQTTLKQGGETGTAAAQLGVGAVKGAIDAVGDVGGQAADAWAWPLPFTLTSRDSSFTVRGSISFTSKSALPNIATGIVPVASLLKQGGRLPGLTTISTIIIISGITSSSSGKNSVTVWNRLVNVVTSSASGSVSVTV